MTLSQHAADKAETRNKPYDLRDNEGRNHVKGLLLRVNPSGVKVYYAQVARGQRERLGDASQLTLTQARVLAKKKIALALSGHDFKVERQARRMEQQQTLGGYLDGAFKEYAEANIASHRDFMRAVRKAFHHLLPKPMMEINDGIDMARWRKERSKVSISTLRRELTYLKALLNRAVKDRVIAHHQLENYTVAARLTDKHAETKVRWLSDHEEARLRQALRDRDRQMKAERASSNEWRRARGYELKPSLNGYSDHLEPLVLVAMNTGLRRGDLLNLRWDNVDLKRKQVTLVIGKTSHARRKRGKPVEPVTLPLSTEAAEVLTKLKEQSTGEYVFTGPGGERLTEVKKSFENLLVRAQIENFRFHDLRHHFASKLVMAGVDLNTVRELMTHSDIKMTLIYAHLSPDHKAAALDRAFGGAS